MWIVSVHKWELWRYSGFKDLRHLNYYGLQFSQIFSEGLLIDDLQGSFQLWERWVLLTVMIRSGEWGMVKWLMLKCLLMRDVNREYVARWRQIERCLYLDEEYQSQHTKKDLSLLSLNSLEPWRDCQNMWVYLGCTNWFLIRIQRVAFCLLVNVYELLLEAYQLLVLLQNTSLVRR